jgi:hypothetical protein
VLALDSRIDRTRPMHHDRVEMLWLQHEHGDVTHWACLDPADPPVDPDPEVPDLGVG